MLRLYLHMKNRKYNLQRLKVLEHSLANHNYIILFALLR